ncbi:MAG TPA: SRPBCC domain-containing protein [Candidatus Limnocylindrales bacterium]|nr:SRPBCC domain-containing protein [Candidatus Limnocylindrales bacterium]
MRLEGTIDIAASPEAIWAVIIDPRDLAACVPGVGDVRQLDDRTFEGSVRAAVGPIDGDFSFRSVISQMTSPNDLIVDVEGTDSVTRSRVVAHIEAGLTSTSDDSTTLAYRATITTKGRLAIIGDMVLRATAGVMIGQVTKCLRSRLEAPA